MKKKLIIVIPIIAIIIAFVVYKMYNKPHVNVANTKSDVVITAINFFDAFANDETTANTTYLDKIVAVSGTISKIETEDNIAIISLQTNDDFGSVLCHLSEEASKNKDAYKIDDNITLKGICTGFLMDVVLVKCEIVK